MELSRAGLGWAEWSQPSQAEEAASFALLGSVATWRHPGRRPEGSGVLAKWPAGRASGAARRGLQLELAPPGPVYGRWKWNQN